MERKTFECELGTITYRLPLIDEVMILLGEIGVDNEEDHLFEVNQNMIYVGRLVRIMKPYIVSMDLQTVEGEKVTDFDVSRQHYEFMEPLASVAGAILEKLEMADKKKRGSRKQSGSGKAKSPSKQSPKLQALNA